LLVYTLIQKEYKLTALGEVNMERWLDV